jgi:MFS family permease
MEPAKNTIPQNKQKLWTKNFIFATFSGLFSSLVFYITMTTLAVFAAETYHVSTGISGLAAGIFVIGSAAGRLLSGRYIELVGRRKLILWGGVLFLLVGMIYMIPLSLIFFLCVRFFHGMAFGILHNALSTVVISYIPSDRRGEGIGYFSLNFVFATALGPFIGILLIHHFSYTMLFGACAVFALIALILVCFMDIKAPDFTEEQMMNLRAKHSITDMFEKKAMPLAIIIIIMSMCYQGVTTFIDTYTIELHLANFAPVFFIVYAAMILVVRPLAGRLLDKKGDNFVMLPIIIFFAASLLTLSFAASLQLADSKLMIVLAAILMALGYGNILNMGQAIAVNSVPIHRVGTATSTYFIFNDLGQGLGPLLLGLIAASKGFPTMYLVESIIVLLSIVLYYALHGAHAGKGVVK